MASPLDRPRRFGKYRLTAKIGMGGMAEVYLAEYAKDPGKPIAIKKILADLSRDKKLISMLVNEAKLAMMLRHPNIVPIYDFGLVDGHYFIAMEYIHGKDIRSFLKKAYLEGKIMPLEITLHVIVSLLEGLHYAHTKKDNFNNPLEIIHRDISPQNIIVSYDGDVKVLDFGIAKAKGSLSESQAGILKGKFSYMSPEQAKGKDLDPRSDLFSAGIILHELLTTRSLFGDQSEIKTIEKVRKAKIPNPSSINPNVPKTLAKIVMKALAKRRFTRFQTAADFREQILLWAYDHGIMINRDITKEYIGLQFPAEAEPLKIPEHTERPSNRASSKIDTQRISPHIKIEGVIEDMPKDPAPLEDSGETILEPLSPIPSLLKSVPSRSIEKRASKVFNYKLISSLLILFLLVLLFINRTKIHLSPELFKKVYTYVVLKPRNKIRDFRTRGKIAKAKLPFNPNLIFKHKPEFILSSEAREYLSKLPLKKHDDIIDHIRKLATREPKNELRHKKSRFAGVRIVYSRFVEGGYIIVHSIS